MLLGVLEDREVGQVDDGHVRLAAGVGDHQVGEMLGVVGREIEAADDGDDAGLGVGLVLAEHREHRDLGALAAASAVSIAVTGWPEMAMKSAPASTACCIAAFGPCGSDGS